MTYIGMKYRPREYQRVKVNEDHLKLKSTLFLKVKAYQSEKAVHVIRVPNFWGRVYMTLLFPLAIIVEGIGNVDYVKDVLFIELFGEHAAADAYFFAREEDEFFEKAFPGIWY